MREDEKSERMPIFLIFIWPHQSWFLRACRKVCRGYGGYNFLTWLCRQKKGRLKRMAPTCQADIVDMFATDTNVCRLGGVADRHKSWHCQPRIQVGLNILTQRLCSGSVATATGYANGLGAILLLQPRLREPKIGLCTTTSMTANLSKVLELW